MNRTVVFALAAASLMPAGFASARTSQREVDVVVDMTEAGRLAVHPSPEHPLYYFPIIGGYHEKGALVAGEKPPPPASVIHLVAVELAKQGYLTCMGRVADAKAKTVSLRPEHNPDLIVLVHWGYMNPQIDDLGADPNDPAGKVFFNQNEMLALVGGNTLNHLDLDFEREGVMQAAQDDRYFIVVSAYDFAAYNSAKKKKVCLWQAKMSVASNGVDFTDVMTALVKAGGPLFGRETIRPKMLMAPMTPEGHVEVGTPTVKDYLDAPVPAAPAK